MMLLISVFTYTGNQDIIQIHDGENEITKHLILESLECLRCIFQTKDLWRDLHMTDDAVIAAFEMFPGRTAMW